MAVIHGSFCSSQILMAPAGGFDGRMEGAAESFRARAEARRVEDRKALLADSIKERTNQSYQTAVNYYERLHGEISMSNPLTVVKIMDMIVFLTEQGNILPSTLRKYIAGLKTIGEIKLGVAFSREESGLIERALKGGQARLQRNARPPKKAETLCDEAVKALARMSLVEGSLDCEIRDVALAATCMVLRFDDVKSLKGRDIECIVEAPGLLVTVSLGPTKTQINENRETVCDRPYDCRKYFCMAHWLQKKKRVCGDEGRLFPRVSLMNTNKFGEQFRGHMKKWYPHHIRDWAIEGLTAHSFRHSGASILVESGCDDSTVRTSGGWSQSSSVWHGYAKRALIKKTRGNASKILGEGS